MASTILSLSSSCCAACSASAASTSICIAAIAATITHRAATKHYKAALNAAHATAEATPASSAPACRASQKLHASAGCPCPSWPQTFATSGGGSMPAVGAEHRLLDHHQPRRRHGVDRRLWRPSHGRDDDTRLDHGHIRRRTPVWQHPLEECRHQCWQRLRPAHHSQCQPLVLQRLHCHRVHHSIFVKDVTGADHQLWLRLPWLWAADVLL